jgi:polar amino acid transport system substrate-binding protein
LRIGIDPEWYPIDFGPQQAYVNGFTEDLLLEIAGYSGIEFERVDANWDTLLEGIWGKKYDAVITSLPPYIFNVAKYDFSHNFLDLGPVLIVPVNARHTELSQMKGELVGVITGDPASLLLQKYPDVILRNYPSIPDLLGALANGEIEGALLNRIPAVNYIADLFAGQLKIASPPMTDAGLHLVAAKGKHEPLIKAFDRSIDQFKKKKKLQTLLKKWNLS